jgi:D-alanyl-D-alanine carboxypeptidase (penicillin-binding protein 5/6)
MATTQFKNATGLPAKDHYTSAWDLAVLTRDYVKRFPESYAIYAERSFKYGDIEQPNRNRLLWRDRSVDGVKTGHTIAAGYCLIASALRDNMRLISVVMGTDSDDSRMRESQKLLSYGFRYFETQQLYDANVPLKTTDVWYGETESLDVGVGAPVVVTIPRGHYDDVEAEIELAKLIEAPISVGDEFGELRLRMGGELIYAAPLVALQDVAEAGMLARAGDFFSLFFSQLFSND